MKHPSQATAGSAQAQSVIVAARNGWHTSSSGQAPPQVGYVASPHGVEPMGRQAQGAPSKMAVGPHSCPAGHVPLQNGCVSLSQGWVPSGTQPQ